MQIQEISAFTRLTTLHMWEKQRNLSAIFTRLLQSAKGSICSNM